MGSIERMNSSVLNSCVLNEEGGDEHVRKLDQDG